jgi:hypothetical protein
VAVILALGLAVTAIGIVMATIVQITRGTFPEVSLSENATQVLTATIGGMVGVLGGYVGFRMKDRP